MSADQTVEQPPLIALALVSATSLALEVLLLQIFSVVEWHHFAYMVISVALLGFGASGTFVFLTQRLQLANYRACIIGYAVTLAIVAPLTFTVTKLIPYNSLAFLWDARQWWYLFELYVLLALPFFLAGSCICLSICRFENRAGLIYSADMLGAGSGAVVVVLAMFWLPPDKLLQIIGCIAWVAGLTAWLKLRAHRARWLAALAFSLLLLVVFPSSWLRLDMSQFKGLQQQLEIPGSQRILEIWNPLGLTSVVASPEVPLRNAPGMSLASRAPIPQQHAIFVNGDGPEALTRWDGRTDSLTYLDQLTSALPYHLRPPGELLVIGASSSDAILKGLHDSWSVDVVEINPALVQLLTVDFADFWGYSSHRQEVRFHHAEARSWLKREDRPFDLIELPLAGSHASAGSGLHGLMENYLLTVEGLSVLLEHLNPGGILSISQWQTLPPRGELRLITTARHALKTLGVTDPARHIIAIRSWQTVTILVSRRPFGRDAMQQVRNFCHDRQFDLAAGPDVESEEANQYNILAEDFYHKGANALLGENPEAFLADYKFDVRATYDNRPYFANFFRWESLREILALRTVGGAALLEWSYPLLVLTFAQALLAGAIFIMLPITLVRRTGHGMTSIVLYFGAIGFGFMFVEIGFIQKLVLLLGHPLYSIPVVLASFLVFAGIGSRISERLPLSRARLPFFALIAVSVLYLAGWPLAYEWLSGASQITQVLMSVLLLAPLAFTMGMPLPLGVRRVAEKTDRLIPWGWAINGSASVAGAVLATIIAVHAGFAVLITAALALYALAASVRL